MEPHLTAMECHLAYWISVTCHPTQVNTLRLNPSQTDRYLIYLPQKMEGWIDLSDLLRTERWFTRQKTVTHPSTNRAQCRLTTLIEANVLTTTQCCHPTLHYYKNINSVLLSLKALNTTKYLIISGKRNCNWICGVLGYVPGVPERWKTGHFKKFTSCIITPSTATKRCHQSLTLKLEILRCGGNGKLASRLSVR